jgi:CspA family cold shock protein
MEKGRVIWFSRSKGYGFIGRDNGEDVFVHFSSIRMEGYRTLEEGAKVAFEPGEGPKGPQAFNVVPLG